MSSFFAFEDSFPYGRGFALFGPGHLVWLLGILAAAGAAGRLYAGASPLARRRGDLAMGVVLLALELAYNAILFFGGHLYVYMLPLHLCALSVVLCVLHCFTGARWLGQYLYYLGMPGALCALLFPNWNTYPLSNYFCISGFVIHGLLVIRGWMLLRSGSLRPDLRGLMTSAAFVFAAAVPIYYFNRRFGTNYMFLMTPSAGSPLTAVQRLFGSERYLLGFFLLFFAVELLLWLPWGLTRRRK